MIRASVAESRAIADVTASDFIDLSGTPWRRIMLSERDNVWCLVDAIDYPWLSENNWNVSWGSGAPWKFYAKRNVGRERATLRMHREIMIIADPRDYEFSRTHLVDHCNGNGLDNRRGNLRWATTVENRANTRPRGSIPTLDQIVAELVAGLCRQYPLAQEVPF